MKPLSSPFTNEALALPSIRLEKVASLFTATPHYYCSANLPSSESTIPYCDLLNFHTLDQTRHFLNPLRGHHPSDLPYSSLLFPPPLVPWLYPPLPFVTSLRGHRPLQTSPISDCCLSSVDCRPLLPFHGYSLSSPIFLTDGLQASRVSASSLMICLVTTDILLLLPTSASSLTLQLHRLPLSSQVLISAPSASPSAPTAPSPPFFLL